MKEINKSPFRTAISLACAAVSAAAQAIVPGIETADWPYAGKFGDASSFATSAVAVGDRWILTAGHAAWMANADGRFQLDGGPVIPSVSIYRHATDDIAVVELASTLPGWYPIFTAGSELGQTFEMVGYGVRGQFVNGNWEYEGGTYGTKRRGRNVVSRIQRITGGVQGYFLIADFDGNNIDSFGDGGPVTDESTVGGGDSGGPSFISDGGVWKVAGLHIWVADAGGGRFPPRYGSFFGDIRISAYKDWISSIIAVSVLPNSFSLFRGVLVSGGLAELLESDDQRMVLKPGPVLSQAERTIQLILEGTSPTPNPAYLQMVAEAHANISNINQRIEAFNFSTNGWVQLDSRTLPTTDLRLEIGSGPNPNPFVEPGTNAMRARLSYKEAGPVFSYPWFVRIDQAIWRVVR